MTQLVDDPVAAGREAARRGAFIEAYELLAPARESLEPDDLERLAEAAWWTGKLDEAIGLRERAYTGYSNAGETKRAAMIALALFQDFMGKGSASSANGWFGRAERLLENEPESLEHGHLAVSRAHRASVMGELAAAIEHADAGYEAGSRYGDRNLQAIALVLKGRALVMSGEVSKGLALLDEATAAAVSGELDALATGLIYCCTIDSCRTVGDYGRAAEWTAEATRWCDRLGLKGFPGACRVHRAELLRLKGEWPEAEEQALQACEELQSFEVSVTAAGFYEIGEIRRRRGDFAAAEEAYRKANELGRTPQPGLALLRLEQGKVDAAGAAIRRSLGSDLPPLARAQILPAQVEIALAAGDLLTARAAAEELEQIADAFHIDGTRTPALDATAHLAWGQIHLSDRDWEAAEACLARARAGWQRIGAPYEVARARMHLGLAYRGQGDEDGAEQELSAAKAAFERLGAVFDAQRIAELLGEVPVTRTFMFTDIVDSTKLAEAIGEAKWQKVLAWHDRTLSELLKKEAGEIIKHTGDGFFAAFERPKEAIQAAVAIQRALENYEGIAPDVRIGVHAGGAFAKDEGDYGGTGPNEAARVAALAGGGEIVATLETVDGAASRFRLSVPRTVELKGISEPVQVVSVDWR